MSKYINYFGLGRAARDAIEFLFLLVYSGHARLFLGIVDEFVLVCPG